MNIDLGDAPVGTPPDAGQKAQIRLILATKDIASGGTGATTEKDAVTSLTTQVDTAATSIALSAATHSGLILRCTAATAVTITVTGDLGAKFNCLVIQAGAGQITFVGAGGATINSFGAALKTAGQHASASILRVAASTYNLSGNLTA